MEIQLIGVIIIAIVSVISTAYEKNFSQNVKVIMLLLTVFATSATIWQVMDSEDEQKELSKELQAANTLSEENNKQLRKTQTDLKSAQDSIRQIQSLSRTTLRSVKQAQRDLYSQSKTSAKIAQDLSLSVHELEQIEMSTGILNHNVDSSIARLDSLELDLNHLQSGISDNQGEILDTLQAIFKEAHLIAQEIDRISEQTEVLAGIKQDLSELIVELPSLRDTLMINETLLPLDTMYNLNDSTVAISLTVNTIQRSN